MRQYIAFLRAINVGGRNVKMAVLRQLFEGLGFSQVATYIASGNVVFETPRTDTSALEAEIAAALHTALGFEVAAFIRTVAEVGRVVEDIPFSQDQLAAASALNVAFLHEPLDDEQVTRLMGFRTDIDDFAVQGREIYWMCRIKQSDSKFSNAVLEKTLGVPATLRGIWTLQKMAAKFGPVED
jgi:uncharacterized protein (DUF1697 family)